MNYCPLGLECVIEESAPLWRGSCCVNAETCYKWTEAWEIPYWRDCEELIVSFTGVYSHLQIDLSGNPITANYDWSKYFAEHGFAEAVNLPYFLRFSNGTMMVSISEHNICREELQQTGWANAVDLPLQNRIIFYSSDLDDNFRYLEVDLTRYDDDDALNALNAGYANAIDLTPVSLDEQRREYFDEYEDD